MGLFLTSHSISIYVKQPSFPNPVVVVRFASQPRVARILESSSEGCKEDQSLIYILSTKKTFRKVTRFKLLL